MVIIVFFLIISVHSNKKCYTPYNSMVIAKITKAIIRVAAPIVLELVASAIMRQSFRIRRRSRNHLDCS
jgi:hypothetical protein